MPTSNRALLVLAGGVILPTLVLAYLGMDAALRREEGAEVRLQQAIRREVEMAAAALSARVEDRASVLLGEAAQVGATAGREKLPEVASGFELRHPAVRHLFVMDAAGNFVWPTMPTTDLATKLAQQARSVHPTALALLHPPSNELAPVNEAQVDADRYRSALAAFQPLLRQNDPWLRTVALDLIAQCHVQLGEWAQALAAYRRLATEGGDAVDAAGIPLALGVQLESAYIEGQLGNRERLVAIYLDVYEQLVSGRLGLPEVSRRDLNAMVRQVLDGLAQDAAGLPSAIQVRFDSLQIEETRLDGRREFLREARRAGLPRQVMEAAPGSGMHRLAWQGETGWTVLFWLHLADGIAVGCQVEPVGLAREIGLKSALGSSEGLSVQVIGPGAAGPPDTGTGLRWEAEVPAMPCWRMVGWAPAEGASTAGGLLHAWLAGLAVAVLAVGVYGLVRTARERMTTAQLQADFVSGVTHELRTPLTSIGLFTDILLEQREGSAAERYRFLATIRRECRRLEHVVANVLAYAQSRNGALAYRKQPLDLGAVVQVAVQAFEPFAALEEIRVETQIGDDVPWVAGDAERLESVVFDLLDNAARYGGAGGQIEVSVFGDNGSVVMEVADRGPGVAADERRRIFRPFYRGREGQRVGKGGTGLGLAVVSRIVADHGGSVGVRGRPDGGCVFSVALPARKEDADGGRPVAGDR